MVPSGLTNSDISTDNNSDYLDNLDNLRDSKVSILTDDNGIQICN